MVGLDSPLPGLKHLLDTLLRVVHRIKTLCYAWPCNVALLCFRKMHGNIMLCKRRVLSILLKGFCCVFFFVFCLGIFSGGSKSDVGPNNSTCSSNARSQKVAVDSVSGLLKLGVVFLPPIDCVLIS